jgi:hypothetical protein
LNFLQPPGVKMSAARSACLAFSAPWGMIFLNHGFEELFLLHVFICGTTT